MSTMEPGKIYHTVYIDFMVDKNPCNSHIWYSVWIQLTEDSVEQNPIRIASDKTVTFKLKWFEKFVYDFMLREVYSKYKDVKLVITER